MKTLTSFAAVFLFAWLAQATPIEIKTPQNLNATAEQERTVDRYSYNFGRVLLNTTQYASYNLTNTGETPLTFQRATISGADYRATHTCTGVLAPKQVCRFDIRYSPFFEGMTSGRFILSFVENLDIVVNVWGEGYRF